MRRLIAGAGLAGLVVSSLAIGAAATTSEGTLDASFGVGGADGNGVVSASYNNDESETRIAVQTDGRIVISGQTRISISGSYATKIVLLRLNANGSADTTFGGQGVASNGFLDTRFEYPVDVAVDAAGRVVVLAYSSGDLYLTRYTTLGAPDTGFAGGTPITILNSYDESAGLRANLAVLPDGRILVGGTNTAENFFIRQYTTAGVPDESFGGGDGLVNTDLSFFDRNGTLRLQRDGKIIVAGNVSSTDPVSDCEIAVIRYNSDGTLDTTFSDDGRTETVTTGCNRLVNLGVSPEGQIVMLARKASSETWPVFSLFPTGNGAHYAEIDALTLGYGERLLALAVQTDGRVLIAGRHNPASYSRVRLIRLNANLTLDTSFGGGGGVAGEFRSSLGSTQEEITTLAIAPDNSIIAGGLIRPGGLDDHLIAKFTAISTAATLQSLALSTGSLAETFAGATTSYTASVPNTVKTITVTPTAVDQNAVITVNNVTTATGSASAPISLAAGANFVNLRVTAQDGVTEKIYTITVTRRNATVKVKKTMTAKAAMASVDKPLPRGAKVRITVARSSRNNCSATSSTIRGLKKGTCTVTIAVAPPPTSLVKKPKATRTTVTITIN